MGRQLDTNQTHNFSTQGSNETISKDEAMRRIAKALNEIQYGEIVVKIQAGKPVWVDKYERERVG